MADSPISLYPAWTGSGSGGSGFAGTELFEVVAYPSGTGNPGVNYKMTAAQLTAALSGQVGGGGGFNPYFPTTFSPVAPVASGFTLYQNAAISGSGSITNLANSKGIRLNAPQVSNSSDNIVLAGVPVSGTSWSRYSLMSLNYPGAWNFSLWGLFAGFQTGTGSGSGQYVFFGFGGAGSNGTQFKYDRWTQAFGFGSRVNFTMQPDNGPLWMNLNYSSGGNFTFQTSKVGEAFDEVFAVSVTDYLSGAPNVCGLVLDYNVQMAGTSGSGTNMSMNCFSFGSGLP